MKLFEIILIALGVSLDIFARIICMSSSYSKIDYKKVLTHGLVFALWQLLSLALGDVAIELMLHTGITNKNSNILHLIAVIILATLAVQMLLQGIRSGTVPEHKNDEISILGLIKSGISIGIRTFFIGMAFGAFETNLSVELLILIIAAMVVSCVGLVYGYRYGYVFRNKAYFFGSLLLAGTDVCIFCRSFAMA